MDNLMLDQMLPEYQEKREEAEEVIREHKEESEPSKDDVSSSSTSSRSSSIQDSPTVPISDDSGPDSADSGAATRPDTNQSASDSSTTSSSDHRSASSLGSASLYQPGFMVPTINYERDNSAQKLVAVIGREFDRPSEIASKLQKLVSNQSSSQGESDVPLAKFVPFTLKRKVLLKGSFESKELRQHDLICMSYNASEARILLTGVDGFYSSLLKHVEALLGPNKVAFLISNYTPVHSSIPEQVTADSSLISPTLKARLSHQEPLRTYLDSSQILSWSDEPNKQQVDKLVELANMELNPLSIFANPNCCIL